MAGWGLALLADQVNLALPTAYFTKIAHPAASTLVRIMASMAIAAIPAWAGSRLICRMSLAPLCVCRLQMEVGVVTWQHKLDVCAHTQSKLHAVLSVQPTACLLECSQRVQALLFPISNTLLTHSCSCPSAQSTQVPCVLLATLKQSLQGRARLPGSAGHEVQLSCLAQVTLHVH